MRVVHFQRKPVSERYFSIENSFEAVREELVKLGVTPEVAICTHISQGFLPRLKNTWEAKSRQGDVNHITGDVHYLNLFFTKRKTILTIHDCVFMQRPSALARKVLKLFWLTLPASKSAYITCISEATKKELLSHISFPTERILVIPTVVKEGQFGFSTKEFNSSCPTILQVGTTPNKNIERIAEALKGLSCRLEIIGPLSDVQTKALEENSIQYRNEVGISNDRMTEKYREADLVLFASTYEGFGMPILEAQLTGRPVITSNLLPMSEVAGNAACLADPFDPASIRAGVEKIIADDSYRTDLIQKGQENVKRFSAKRIAEMYLALYKKVDAD